MTPFDSRRRLLLALASGAGTLALSGCDRLSGNPGFNALLRTGETLTMRSQRLLLQSQPLAREYTESDLSPRFRANGTMRPEAGSLALINCNTPMISFSWFFIGTVRNDCERYPVFLSKLLVPEKSNPFSLYASAIFTDLSLWTAQAATIVMFFSPFSLYRCSG